MSKNLQPIPDNPEQIYFDSDAAIYKHIGRNQIDSETVALTEIVKNSYDADATEVRIYFDNPSKPNGEIIITDNGTGMTPVEFKKYWMHPATSHKEGEPRSRIFRRVLLGRKGMGRFGTDKISSVVVIKSKTKEDKIAFSAKIDGNLFDQPGAKFEKTPVEFRTCHHDLLKFVLNNYLFGTEIRMKNLRTKWSRSMIKEFRDELSCMISPNKSASEFNVFIDVHGDDELSGKLENTIKEGFSHDMLIQVDQHDTYTITLNGRVHKTGSLIDDCEELLTNTSDETISGEIVPLEIKRFGPVTARILYFKDGGLVKRETIKHGKRVDHSGIKLYRSGFRVLPYGEKTDDWLRIKTKRSARGGKYYVSPDKISGTINIDADHNPKLEDTTNRQSLIFNEEFKTFRFFFSEIVVDEFNRVLEREQTTVKEEIRKKRHQNISRQVADILSKLRSELVKKVVQDNTKRRKEEAKRLVMDSEINKNGGGQNRKTHEERKTNIEINKNGEKRKKYQKHRRILIPTDRYVVRPVDAWIEGTRWIVRDEYEPNEELEAWVNELEQEIVYNTGHSMFVSAELSDKLVGQNLETGCGIATQMHIHKSVALAWALYPDQKERGSFSVRYKEYEDLASNLIRGNSKFVEEIPEEDLLELSPEEMSMS